jgi:hypothetical protein
MNTFNKKGYLKRIEALKSRTTSMLIVCTMPDNSKRTLKRNQLLKVWTEAVHGISSSETETLLTSVSDNSGTRMAELLQMLF